MMASLLAWGTSDSTSGARDRATSTQLGAAWDRESLAAGAGASVVVAMSGTSVVRDSAWLAHPRGTLSCDPDGASWLVAGGSFSMAPADKDAAKLSYAAVVLVAFIAH